MAEQPIVLIKLGGSLITDKQQPETPRPEVIARLAGEIARARPKMPERILLGHGSGSFGHASAARYGLAEGLHEAAQGAGIAITQAAAARLDRLVIDALIAAGTHPFALAPSSFLVTVGGRPRRLGLEPLLRALAIGLLPVVYGDVVTDQTRGVAIASTETVVTAIARELRRRSLPVSRALWVGATTGVYGLDGELLPEITAASWKELRPNLDGAAGIDVTGGIRLRIDACMTLAGMGIPSLILDGREEGRLERALLGEEVPGTWISAMGAPFA